MSGQRHLIECHCILPLYKDKKPIVYHKLAVYSLLDHNEEVVPKYVNCNNCGVTHYVKEFCKSEIKLGKEDIRSVRDISEVSLSLPKKLTELLDSYNSTIDLYEQVEDIIDNNNYPENLVIRREIIDEKYHLKILQVLGKERFKIISESLEDTIIEEQ